MLAKSYLSIIALAGVGSEATLLTDKPRTIATIVEADSLREENKLFYKDTQNWDKLIVFY